MMFWRTTYHFAGILVASSKLTWASWGVYLGISLGIDYLTSAYITESDDFVTVASVNATQPWKDFSSSLLQTSGDGQYLTNSKWITNHGHLATETKLNRNIEILAIIYPNYISGGGYVQTLLDTAIDVLPDMMKDASQVRPYQHSIRQAYNLNNAESLGYPPGTDIDQELNLILHVDYQRSLLEVSIIEIGKKITVVTRQFQISDFGGRQQVASLENLEFLSSRFKFIINQELSAPSELPSQLGDFKRIIFSGDAPTFEFQKIREAILKVVPEFSDRFAEGINPKWVGAVGAARRAKEYKLNPPPSWDEAFYLEELHDEL